MVRSKSIFAFILILLFLMAFETICIQPIKAQYQGDITINADGSITPSLAPIQQVGNVYRITSNIDGRITINKSDIALQGNKYTITVPSLFGSGITLNDVSNCTVSNVAVSGGQYGINIYGTLNLVANNTISSVNNGIYSLNEPNGGIALTGTSNSIYGNSFQSNLVGINFFGGLPLNCSYNLIVGNTFTDCSTALLLSDSSNNTFYHNRFFNNKRTVYDSSLSINTWDNGYPSGGNYWSDYLTKYPNAKMIDSSGLGDTAYVIETQNEDRYPIINLNQFYNFQHTPAELSIVSPISQSYNESIVPLKFTVDKPVNWVGYSLDGQQNVTVSGNTTLTGLNDGLHYVTVYANDSFGNMGASSIMNFTITLPTLKTEINSSTLIVVISISAVLVIAICLIIYRRHRKTVYLK